MAESEVPPTTNGLAQLPELDIQKLHSLPSEQQELYLLDYVANLATTVSKFDITAATKHQRHVKGETLKIIGLGSPVPGRVIRTNLGRALAGVLSKGDRKLLFESINDLAAIVNAGKEKDLAHKHAAAHCLGAVYASAGDSAINLSSLASTSLLRLLKSTQSHAGARGGIYTALGRIYIGIGGSADEAIAREAFKQARNAAYGDKSYYVQKCACFCLEQLVSKTPFFDNSNDYERLQNSIWKAIESHSTAVRHAAASCFSTVLVKAYSDNPIKDAVPRLRKPKKSSKRQDQADAEDGEIERSGSPAQDKPAAHLSFGLPDLLRQLAIPYCRPTISNRGRASLALCYIKVLRRLGEAVVERNYPEIARHLFVELLSYPIITHHRYRLLITRRFVQVILEEVMGGEMLGESAQLSAARFLINDILKDYPQALKERPEPSKQVLTATLSALASLIQRLGAATNSIAESCREALLQVLTHPSYTVQVHTSHCLRAFVLACPQQLLPTLTICMNSVNRELGHLSGPRHSPRRCTGYANGLSATLSTAREQPLYGSVDIYSRILTQATTLLKSSGSSDLRISSTQIQVAWILLGGLMSLGPNFVKIHLSQLLLLWKNALPKPLNKDDMSRRSLLELSFLAHVRECALGAMLPFLEYNRRLLTNDVSRRLAAMLHNTVAFLSWLPTKKSSEDIGQRLSPSLQLHDYDIMVRRRVFQSYNRLIADSPAESREALLQSNFLSLATTCFAEPVNYGMTSLSASIASAAANFESIWDVGDNYGFGIAGLVNGFDVEPLPGVRDRSERHSWLSRHGVEGSIDQTISRPACGAREYDSVLLYRHTSADDRLPDPPTTEVVNAAIQLFAIALPLHTAKIQESIVEQLTSFLADGSLQRDPARRAAISVNVVTALLAALKVAVKETSLHHGDLKTEGTQRTIRDLLHGFIFSPDQIVRFIAAQALGRLCKVSNNHAFTAKEVDDIVAQIVSNRDPNARAGCALALGSIYEQLGEMSAGFHLKKILGILNSLSTDAHPTVHFWALEGIGRVADSASLNFAPFVSSSLGMLAQLYASDSHNEESSSFPSSNLEVELSTPPVIAKSIDSIINVLGPDLQDAVKARDLIMTLVNQFQGEENNLVLVQSLRCQEHLFIYAPTHLQYTSYIKQLQQNLTSEVSAIRSLAIDGLHNLMRRDANEVIKNAEPGLEEQLWVIMDKHPDEQVYRNIFRNWLHQSGLKDTSAWIQRCNMVLTKVTLKADVDPKSAAKPATAGPTAGPDLVDEEVAGFAAATGTTVEDEASTASSAQELLNWQTRVFAMDLLSELITMVAKDAVQHDGSASESALQAKVGDVVRIAFSASTAGVVALRIKGLQIVDQILKQFGKTPDPDFTEALLLEQYQAQIGSALTPAFASDSSPELASEAINVCATFIATGIVTDVERMGRILKLLVSSLESFATSSDSASIGDLKGLTSNALVMVRMSVFSAWAELQIASSEQKYLLDVLRPHIVTLTPLWLSSLKEYARLRFEPEISMTGGTSSLSDNLDVVYSALNRETLLQFYQSAWLQMVEAIASLIDDDSALAFDALEGRETTTTNGNDASGRDINYRDEPVAFFFVLFGLAFEALVSRSSDSQSGQDHTMDILQALKKILRPSVAGQAIYQEVVFSETMDLLDRLVLTEALNVQSVIVEIARNLCLAHPSARKSYSAGEEERLSEDIDQLFELTRIIVLVLAGLVPNLTEDKSRVQHVMNDEAVALLTLSVNALVDASAAFPSVIKTDLHACIIHIFTTILGTPSCQEVVVSQMLPVFKRFVTSILPADSLPQEETQNQLRGALLRCLSILKYAQQREFESAIQCEKNALLACTVLLSTAGAAFTPNDPLINRFVGELIDCLGSRLPTKTAANCSRSLLLMPKRSPADDAVQAAVLPYLLEFLITPSDVESIDESRALIGRALVEFTLFLISIPAKTSVALALVVPTLLARAAREGKPVYKETATRLLELASGIPDAFRAIVASMESEQRTLLEEVLREGGVGKREGQRSEAAEPTIALKMDFGIGGGSGDSWKAQYTKGQEREVQHDEDEDEEADK